MEQKTLLNNFIIKPKVYWVKRQFFNLTNVRIKRPMRLANQYRAQGFVKLKKINLRYLKFINISNLYSNSNISNFVNPMLGNKLNLKNKTLLDKNLLSFNNDLISFNISNDMEKFLSEDIHINSYLNKNKKIVYINKHHLTTNKNNITINRLSLIKNILDMLIFLKA